MRGIETLGLPGGGGKALMSDEAHGGCSPKERLLRMLKGALGTPRCVATEAQLRRLEKTMERISGGENPRR